MPTRQRKSAEQRKAEIVDATLKLAFQVGPEAITTERIAQKVGITQPAVFRHFPRKEDIWVAVVGWIGDKLASRWGRALHSNADAMDQLHAILQAQLGLIQSTPAIPAILFSRELHIKNRTLRAVVTSLLGRFHELLKNIIDSGIHSRTFRADLDSTDAAFVIIALVQGSAVRWSLSERSFNLVDEGDRLLAVVLQGFLRSDAGVK